MQNGVLERHYSNIFTLPKKRITLSLGLTTIIFASILYGTARAFFATRYLVLGFSFIVLILILGKFIHLAFDGRRTFFLAFLMLIFIEIFDFIVFHLGLPYLISLTPAIISTFLVIVLYFTSEANEKIVGLISYSMVLFIYPINYLLSFDAPSRTQFYALTGIYVLLSFLGTFTGYMYIRFFDKDMGFNVKDFLRGFLLFWLTADPCYLEEKLNAIKTLQKGWIRCLSINDDVKIITNSFHPGPFRNIGGGTLVSKILNLKNTMYLHSATNHDQNPVSSKQVNKLIDNIPSNGKTLRSLKPYTCENNLFRLNVVPFSDLKIMVVTGKKVIDDLSINIQSFSDTLGNIVIVDGHNAHKSGYDLSSQEIESLKKLIEQAAAIKSEPCSFSYKFIKKRCTSANICEYLSLLILKYDEDTYALLMIDSNNIEKTFREKLEAYFSKKGLIPIILSTDNHMKTGMPPKLEYYPAGEDKSDHKAVYSFLDEIDFTELVQNGSFQYSKSELELDVIGKSFLSNLEKATIKLARKGTYLFIFILFLQLIAAILLGVISE